MIPVIDQRRRARLLAWQVRHGQVGAAPRLHAPNGQCRLGPRRPLVRARHRAVQGARCGDGSARPAPPRSPKRSGKTSNRRIPTRSTSSSRSSAPRWASPRQRGSAVGPIARQRRGARVLGELLSKVSERFGLVLMLDTSSGATSTPRVSSSTSSPLLGRASSSSSPTERSIRTRPSSPSSADRRSRTSRRTVPVARSTEALVKMAELLSTNRDRAADIARESDGCPSSSRCSSRHLRETPSPSRTRSPIASASEGQRSTNARGGLPRGSANPARPGPFRPDRLRGPALRVADARQRVPPPIRGHVVD